MAQITTRPQLSRSMAAAMAGALIAVSTPVAHAQDGDRSLPKELAGLQSCGMIEKPDERLACYDREAPAFLAATSGGEVQLVDEDTAREVRRSLFGFVLPDIGLFGGGEDSGKAEAIDKINTTVTSVRDLGRGKYMFTIEDGGAVWQTTERSMRLRTPKTGDAVELERASLGSYWARFNGQLGVKARRVQ